MLLMIPLAYNMRSLLVRKSTTVATALGIGLVVFVFSSVLMLQNGIKQTMGSTGRPDNAIVVSKGSDAELSSTVDHEKVGLVLSKSDFLAQAASGGALGVAELVVNMTLDKVGTTGVSNLTVRGVELDKPACAAGETCLPKVLAFRPDVKLIAGRMAEPGKGEVIVGKAVRGRFKGVELNQQFELKTNYNLTVVGVFTAGGSSYESEVWGDIDQFRTAFGRGSLSSSVRVRLQSPEKFDAFKAAVESDLNLGLQVERETAFYEKQSEGLAMFLTALGMIIAVFFSFGAMIGAMITMYGTVANRQREIGTLRALGFGRLGILFSFLLESLVLALAGGLIGAIASLAMGFVKFSTMNFTSWSEIVFEFTPTPGIIVGAMIFAGVMGLLGGFFPALRAARISPIQAMRQ